MDSFDQLLIQDEVSLEIRWFLCRKDRYRYENISGIGNLYTVLSQFYLSINKHLNKCL